MTDITIQLLIIINNIIKIIFVVDYLRETEDILSYEPFLGVADPPTDHTITGRQSGGGSHQYHAPDVGGAGVGGAGSGTDPMFAGPINNVTVNVGREAVLECHVNNLRGYKVRYRGGSLPSKSSISFIHFLF